MSTLRSLFMVGAVAALGVGCTPERAHESKAARTQPLDDEVVRVERKLGDASVEMQEARRKVVSKVDERASKLTAVAHELQTRAQVADDNIRVKADRQLAHVDTKRAELDYAVDKLKAASDVALAKYETAADKKLDELEGALVRLESKLK